jgi:hypothetical protein
VHCCNGAHQKKGKIEAPAQKILMRAKNTAQYVKSIAPGLTYWNFSWRRRLPSWLMMLTSSCYGTIDIVFLFCFFENRDTPHHHQK